MVKDTRELIISAAKELFEKKGFAAATTKEIAELAGISEVTLFRHFETKRNLFKEAVHSCMHPYKTEAYLSNEVTYDLRQDLTYIAHDMFETHKQNIPMLKMIMRDKIRGSAPERHMKKSEHHTENKLLEYFQTMKSMGKITAEPDMAINFFISNVTGYIMKEIFMKKSGKNDEKYFAWMLDRIIVALET